MKICDLINFDRQNEGEVIKKGGSRKRTLWSPSSSACWAPPCCLWAISSQGLSARPSSLFSYMVSS